MKAKLTFNLPDDQDEFDNAINGLTGYFMINQDGSILCEARVIKESDNSYKIEYMTKEGWNEFENNYCVFLDEE